MKGVAMRTTVTGLAAAAVLVLAGSWAHAADPYFCPPPAQGGCNSPFYNAGPGGGYGPNLFFQGPSLPPAPFNGMLAIPNRNGCNGNGGMGGGMPFPGFASFPTHPFARSPRDFFMYG